MQKTTLFLLLLGPLACGAPPPETSAAIDEAETFNCGLESYAEVQRGDLFAPPPASSERLLGVRVSIDGEAPFCTLDQLRDHLFGPPSGAQFESVAVSLREASGDRYTLSGDVVGPIEISVDRGTCNAGQWAQLIQAQLVQRGIDPSSYQRVMFFLPGVPCGWAGLGQLPGRWTWISGGACANRGILVHELGHNFGLHHASRGLSEYGDRSDVMGNVRHAMVNWNAPHLIEIGWHESYAVQEVRQTSQYAVAPLSPVGSETAILRIPRQGGDYFVSRRERAGVDRLIDQQFTGSLSIHTGRPYVQSNLLAVLAPGQSFTDSALGLEITAVEQARDLIEASITLTCIEQPLAVEMPIRDFYVRPGGSAAFTLMLENRNTSGCGDRSVSLQAAGSLRVQIEPYQVTLAPGERRTLEATLSLSRLAYERTYAMDLLGMPFTVTVDRTPPPDVINFAGAFVEGNVELYWDPPPFGTEEVEFEVFRDGVVFSRTAVSYARDRQPAPGTYSYTARAVDRAGNTSPETAPLVIEVPKL